MDYGHNEQSGSNQPFFTAGVGTESPSQNTIESENNLDLTNQHSWLENQSLQNIGNKAITSPNDIAESTGQAISQEALHQSGPASETISVSLPPDITMNNTTDFNGLSPTTESYNPNNIRTKGEHLSSDTVAEIDHQITKLNQTGNVSDFYTSIRGSQNIPGMMRQNLKNSYNREVG